MAKFKALMLLNVDPNGSGNVLASPSQSHPDYYYHWVRDGAISMKVLLDSYNDEMYPHILNYVRLENLH